MCCAPRVNMLAAWRVRAAPWRGPVETAVETRGDAPDPLSQAEIGPRHCGGRHGVAVCSSCSRTFAGQIPQRRSSGLRRVWFVLHRVQTLKNYGHWAGQAEDCRECGKRVARCYPTQSNWSNTINIPPTPQQAVSDGTRVENTCWWCMCPSGRYRQPCPWSLYAACVTNAQDQAVHGGQGLLRLAFNGNKMTRANGNVGPQMCPESLASK